MQRGRIFIRAKDSTGRWGSADIFDLDEDSFRAVLLDRLDGLFVSMSSDEPHIELKTKPDVVFSD